MDSTEQNMFVVVKVISSKNVVFCLSLAKIYCERGNPSNIMLVSTPRTTMRRSFTKLVTHHLPQTNLNSG